MWLKEFTIDIKNGMYNKILDYAYQIRVHNSIPYYIMEQNINWYNLQLNWLLFKKSLVTEIYNIIYKTNL